MTFRFSLHCALVMGASLLPSSFALAQDANPPYLAQTIQNVTVPLGTTKSKVKLKKTFALTNVSQGVVRFNLTTETGPVNLDVELRPDVAPATVANFLGYANRGDYSGSFLHRSVPGFIIQGGGYTYDNSQVNTIPAQPAVVNEPNLSNTRGTIAMAKLGGDPNSATDQWFFNEADNSGNLDSQNGGFTVFGEIVGNGLSTLDALANEQVIDAGSPFDQLPVINYTSGATVTKENLIILNSITPVALVPTVDGEPSLLKLSFANSNPNLVTVTLSGQKLLLTYTPGVTGNATIKVTAKSPAKAKAKTSFLVTVQ